MIKEIVMGVDLGFKISIATSAFYSFGDETMFDAVTNHYDEAQNWINEWRGRLSAYLHDFVREHNVDVIVLEDLHIDRMDVNDNMKKHLKALMNEIKQVSENNGVNIAHVNPRNTSRMCSNCGRLGHRNRNSFKGSSCGFNNNADFNAARNIGLRYILRKASQDIREGRNPWKKYFLATLYGPKPISEFEWVRKTLAHTKMK